MKKKTGQIILHVTGCIAFLSLPVLLSPDVSWNFSFVRVRAFQEEFITYTLLLLFFYLNYFSLIPRLFFKQKYIYYFSCILISYAVITFLPHIIIPGNHLVRNQPVVPGTVISDTRQLSSNHPADPQPGNDPSMGMHPTPGNGPPPGMEPPSGDNAGQRFEPRHHPRNASDTGQQRFPDKKTAFYNDGRAPNRNMGRFPPFNHGLSFLFRTPYFEYLFQFIIVLILSTMIRINNRLKQTEKEKVNAELSYLKAQINPHFLFNTLNSIYSSAIEENADNTATAVVKLSGMMRYVISEAHHEYVTLEKEMNYISDYIELQKIRLGNTVHLNYSVAGNTAGKKIAPLILISFIENSFKHGVNPEENSNIEIEIIIHDDILHLSVLNNKVKKETENDLKNNIGLENTKSRLQLLYSLKHELVIKEDEKEFLVLLKMNLQ